jgi:GNAT superfamily N-acetyltransferase
MIRPLQSSDRTGWEQLWRGYLRFYRSDVDPSVTDATFDRLCARADGLLGLIAVSDDDGTPIGLAHVILHPSTWSATRYAYLEDLYVSPAARGGGTAQALIEAVYAEADAHDADRVYWHTQEFNAPARSLYDQVAHRTSFIVYER